MHIRFIPDLHQNLSFLDIYTTGTWLGYVG